MQYLGSLTALLDKTAAHAEATKVDPSVFLGMRLSPSMYPLWRQIAESCRHAVLASSKLAGLETPEMPSGEADIPELKKRLAAAIDFIKALKPEQINGSDDREIVIKLPSGNERRFTGQTLLLNFSLPNFYFHVTTAYDVLRHAGVDLAKRDFLGTPIATV
jgi:hypothetical protein